MATLLTKAKSYYWASIVMSIGGVFKLVQQDFIGVGIFVILSALMIAIGLLIRQKHKNRHPEKD